MFKFKPSRINILGSLILIDFILLRPPSPKLNLSDGISDVTVSESIDLFVSSNCSLKSDPLPFDRLLQVGINVMIQSTFLNQGFLLELWFIFTQFNSDFFQVLDDVKTVFRGVIFRKIKNTTFGFDYQNWLEEWIVWNLAWS